MAHRQSHRYLEGIIAIASEVNPRLLERKLKSFLTPSSRTGTLVSYDKIRERFSIQPQETVDWQQEPTKPESELTLDQVQPSLRLNPEIR